MLVPKTSAIPLGDIPLYIALDSNQESHWLRARGFTIKLTTLEDKILHSVSIQ